MSQMIFFTVVLSLSLSGCALEDGIKSIPLLGEIYRLPDIDQRFVEIPLLNMLINHRSIITHSALVPLTSAWLLRYYRLPGLLISGLVGCLYALHFLLDLFPKKWYGHAWIHIPLLGWLNWIPFDTQNWIPTGFSVFWLSLNLLLSLAACGLVLRAQTR